MNSLVFNGSDVLNIVLAMIAIGQLVFQIWSSSASRRHVRNGLVSIRQMLEKHADPDAIICALDGQLANLGGRKPFVIRAKKTLEDISLKFNRTQNQPMDETAKRSPKEFLPETKTDSEVREKA